MILATYNLWNDERTLISRVPALCEEIQSVNADVIALQEVSASTPGYQSKALATYIAEQSGYPYVSFRTYPDLEDADEGLAILSKYPFEFETAIWDSNSNFFCAIRSIVEIDSVHIAITNVHLDWRCVLNREVQMCAVLDWINKQSKTNTVELLCGDFNDIPDSSIHRFLQGRQSLNGRATKWLDLAEYWQWRSGLNVGATLDFAQNPRWNGVHTLQIPVRFDWIMLRQEHQCMDPEPVVSNMGLFGKTPTPVAKKVPSDHYGVFVKINFSY
ncbi:endonuclease/exonuclease/phosphatase family protein [Paenibacillus tarimensis]